MDAAMHDRGRDFTFLTSRLHSIAGYLDLPAVYAAMKFLLPQFSVTASRFASVGQRTLELWSPNSSHHAFYPGLRTVSFSVGSSLPPEMRRCDGHAGRFDPVMSPQHYDSRNPWFGFIKRHTDNSLPECTPLIDVWDPTGPGNKGIIHWTFLMKLGDRFEDIRKRMNSNARVEQINATIWQTRPQGSITSIRHLDNSLSFDDAVDALFEVQRGLRFMDAWNRLAENLLSPPTVTKSPSGDIIPADDTLMGVWLNGVMEREGIWLLNCRVPCFVVSIVESTNDSIRADRSSKAMNLIAGTSAAAMSRNVYHFDLRVRLAGTDLRDLTKDVGIPDQVPPANDVERHRASPWGQGFINGEYIDPRNPQLLPNRCVAPAPLIRDGEIIPPSIADLGNGSWSRWTEGTLKDPTIPCMEVLGRKRKDDHGNYRYYDRISHRLLFFDEEVSIPSNYRADPDIFGLPVPNIRFVENEENKRLAPRSASYWMYRSERPRREDIGISYSPAPSKQKPSAPPSHTASDSTRLSPSTRAPSPPRVAPPRTPPRSLRRSPSRGSYRSPPRNPHRSPPRQPSVCHQAPSSPTHIRKTIIPTSSFGASAFRQQRSPPQKPNLTQRFQPFERRMPRGDFYRPGDDSSTRYRDHQSRASGKRASLVC